MFWLPFFFVGWEIYHITPPAQGQATGCASILLTKNPSQLPFTYQCRGISLEGFRNLARQSALSDPVS